MTQYRLKDEQGRKHFEEDYGQYYKTEYTEDDKDRIDLFATALTRPDRTYGIEIKDYTNGQHYRGYENFTRNGIDYGYQIDYDKIDYLVNYCKNEHRIPILYARFWDYTIVWDLTDFDYDKEARYVWVNADGQNYGKTKEYAKQTYLYIKDAVKQKPTIIK